MLTNGYVRLYKKILDHPLFTQLPATVLKIWLVCLLRANWQPTKWYDGRQEIEIPAGAFIFAQESFAKFCNVSRDQLRTALRHLQNLECITIRATSRYSLLIVEKWSLYQLVPDTLPQRVPQPIPSASPTDPQPIPIDEEYKNRRIQEHTHRARAVASDLNGKTSGRFEEFWGKYPRKQRKDFAAGQFFSLVTVDTEAAMFACLERYVKSEEVSRNVVMNPDKWLLEQHNSQWEGDWPRKKTMDEIIDEEFPNVER